MQKALHFKDGYSDKFWRVETWREYILTNWGKTDTNGRWQLTELEDAQAAEKEAKKQADSKMRNGYREFKDFDTCLLVYKDTEDYGPHPLTSHPLFREYFSDEMYFECGDEETPFGSDEGSDALWVLQENYKPSLDFTDFPRRLIEEAWEMEYLPPDPDISDSELKKREEDNGIVLMNDQVVIAVTLGQIKITGESDKALRELAFRSLERWERLNRLVYNTDNSPYIAKMRADLMRFEQENCGKKDKSAN